MYHRHRLCTTASFRGATGVDPLLLSPKAQCSSLSSPFAPSTPPVLEVPKRATRTPTLRISAMDFWLLFCEDVHWEFYRIFLRNSSNTSLSRQRTRSPLQPHEQR